MEFLDINGVKTLLTKLKSVFLNLKGGGGTITNGDSNQAGIIFDAGKTNEYSSEIELVGDLGKTTISHGAINFYRTNDPSSPSLEVDDWYNVMTFDDVFLVLGNDLNSTDSGFVPDDYFIGFCKNKAYGLTPNGVKVLNGSNSKLLNSNGGTTTLKTINNQSLIGSGNITISSGTSFPSTFTVIKDINNLTYSTAPSNGTITLNSTNVNLNSQITQSNTGKTVTIPGATSSAAGLLTTSQYSILNDYSSKRNTFATLSTSSLSNYYTKSTSDSRYVSATSNDSKSGNLDMSGILNLGYSGYSLNFKNGTSNNPSISMGLFPTNNAFYLKYTNTSGGGGMPLSINTSNGALTLTQTTFTGNVTSQGTVTGTGFYQSSDINLKENIKEISEDEINKSKEIEFKEFNFKEDETKTKKYGVIAQEIESLGLENLVQTSESGEKTVDYISLLILKVKQLEDEVKELKEQIRNGR